MSQVVPSWRVAAARGDGARRLGPLVDGRCSLQLRQHRLALNQAAKRNKLAVHPWQRLKKKVLLTKEKKERKRGRKRKRKKEAYKEKEKRRR